MTQTLKKIWFFLAFGSFLFLTGCWDSHEIEERGFGVAMAFDMGKESQIETKLKEEGAGFPKTDLITLTYQFINPINTGGQQNNGGAAQKPYINVSQTGDSTHQIIREIAMRMDRPVYTPHLKVLVISEELLNKLSLQKLLDFDLRDEEMRLSAFVLVSKGNASETLDVKGTGDIPAFHLMEIIENRYKSTKILPPMPLVKLTGKIHSGSSFLIQNVASASGEVKLAGAAIINGKTKKWHGFLNEADVEGLTWLTGEGEGGVLKSFDEQTGQIVLFEVNSMKRKITSTIDGNKISFDVNIESDGRLSENWVVTEKDYENEFLKRVEKVAEKEVEGLVKSVLEKMQEEYQVDVAGFGEHLRIEHPKVWEKVKKDWDQTFSEIPITYNVKLTITDYGTVTSK
ncbi:Ger(x)C family spore germination protein [Halalkalibacter alkalisediminis]|uniref:Ger(X)C family spore germination protein n=1 Tax=Halalkalibacter alkalisediminis TaxID=935616 RepID=A0ABV6NHR0_9BACI|nr:Ger(x)C family spore germination protein [Halalkalibacter alkalisediminis]